MKLTYIYHSSFVLETETCSILFDYFRDTCDKTGYVHDVLLKKETPLYLLASHFHSDHFNREIFEWRKYRQNLVYLLSADILKHKKAKAEEAQFLRKGDLFVDDRIRLQAFGSTDVGISFLLHCEGKAIFHAGDLNNWHWQDESTPQEVRQMEGSFLHELKDLKAVCPHLNLAMFPVDSRLGSDYDRGARQFITQLKVDHIVPMHYWERPADTLPFGTYAEQQGVQFHLLSTPGDELILE